MNVAAIKQVAPYAKFLVRAAREKRRFHNKVAMARTEHRRAALEKGDSPLFHHFTQNAIRCQPSGRTSARGTALNAPTKSPL